MITIYSFDTTSFKTNGLAILTPLSAFVTEELNGRYSLDMEYHTELHANEFIVENNIIKCPTPQGYQVFRIYEVKKTLDNILTVKAEHIFYDLLKNINLNLQLSDTTMQNALNVMLDTAEIPNEFNGYSNIAKTNNVTQKNSNIVNAIFNNDNGLIKLYGGEIERDNFNIIINAKRGVDSGFVVRYAKNLTGLNYTVNINNLMTRILPVGYNSAGDEIYLPETYIDSPLIGDYQEPLIGVMKYNDLKVGQKLNGVVLSQSEVIRIMRERTIALYEVNDIDKPEISADVNFILISDTVEFEYYKPLEQIFIGDTVYIMHPLLKINLKSRVVKYVYNAINKRYDSIGLGKIRERLNSSIPTINNINNMITNEIEGLEGSSVEIDSDNTLIIDGVDSNLYLVTNNEKSVWTGKQDFIPVGNAGQYYDGTKTWKNLDKNAVGLGNVDNVQQASKTDFDNHVADDLMHLDNGNANTATKLQNPQDIELIRQIKGLASFTGDTKASISTELIVIKLGTFDINNLTSIGIFSLANNSPNLPEIQPSVVHVTNTNGNATQLQQLVITHTTGNMYIRTGDGTNWTTWATAIMHRIATGDWNDYGTASMYAGLNLANAPTTNWVYMIINAIDTATGKSDST